MEIGTIVLAVVVAFFGLGSAVLGFIAEATKLNKDHIETSWTQCLYPATPAFALGIVAALLLLLTQIIVSVATGCCGCCKPRGSGSSRSKRPIGVLLSALSWIAAVIAEFFYVQAVLWNAPVTHEAAQGRCFYARDGVFRTAAFLSITATVLGITSHFMLRAATATAAVPEGELKPAGVAMGQPVVYGQAPYPPPTPAQGYANFPPPAQGYGHSPPAGPSQQHAQAV